MPAPTNSKERLKKAIEEIREKDKRAHQFDKIDPTYSSRYYQEMEERRKPLPDSRNPLKRKLQAKVPAMGRVGYVRENGIDRTDQGLYTKDKDEFNRRVGATITKNLARAAKNKSKK